LVTSYRMGCEDVRVNTLMNYENQVILRGGLTHFNLDFSPNACLTLTSGDRSWCAQEIIMSLCSFVGHGKENEEKSSSGPYNIARTSLHFARAQSGSQQGAAWRMCWSIADKNRITWRFHPSPPAWQCWKDEQSTNHDYRNPSPTAFHKRGASCGNRPHWIKP
jgi:hypothetical protein